MLKFWIKIFICWLLVIIGGIGIGINITLYVVGRWISICETQNYTITRIPTEHGHKMMCKQLDGKLLEIDDVDK